MLNIRVGASCGEVDWSFGGCQGSVYPIVVVGVLFLVLAFLTRRSRVSGRRAGARTCGARPCVRFANARFITENGDALLFDVLPNMPVLEKKTIRPLRQQLTIPVGLI